LHDREIKIKLQPHDILNYCLYWNLSDHPIMSLTERQVPIVRDKSDPPKPADDLC
jgi:hypothetical protein